MNRLSEEMKIIPRAAKAIAIAAALIVPCIVVAFVFLSKTESDKSWIPFATLIGLSVMLTLSIYILLIGYIAGDARRRGMRPVLWVLLAIFIPNAIGIILYFILREPLLQQCPKCGAGSKASFTFCSVCGEALVKMCPACQGVVQPGWSHCAKCGVALPPA